jgi:PAS domain-containing protein
VVWSPQARALAGLDPEASGAIDDLFERIHAEDRPLVREARARAADPSGDGGYAVEFRVMARDGSTRWLQDAGGMMFDGRTARNAPSGSWGSSGTSPRPR